MKQYTVTGMSCAACSARVEKAVSKVDGVTACSVSLLTNSMGVEGDADTTAIIKAVVDAGYNAAEKTLKTSVEINNQEHYNEDTLKDTETPLLKKRLVTSLGFLIVLMYFSMGHMMFSLPLPEFFENNPMGLGLIQLLLTGIIMVINQKFFVSGFKGWMHKAPNMDTLVALGAGAAFVYSTYALFMMVSAQAKGDFLLADSYMHELYFESAAMILTLITVGKMLEARSKGKTTDALKGLMKLAPKTAVLESGEEVPVEIVKQGDVFVVKPGEQIPVDGEVLEGSSAVNEAALTGESIPVDKEVGDTVSTGTINQSGFLKCRATKVGKDTTLSQIIQMVSDAAATKAPIAKVADKVSGVFVPIVMTIALITIIGWIVLGQSFGYALARGISVLVISCPCALGLATPVAIMVGNGVGAKNGILFKTAISLEETGKIEIVALDKTGTITSGHPRVTDIVASNDVQEIELLAYAYALERKSEHPLAEAVVQYCKEYIKEPLELQDFKVLPGNGLMAYENDCRIVGGSSNYISGLIPIEETIRKQTELLAEQGKTPLLFAKGEQMLGMIAVADVIKEDSPTAMKELQNMGIRVVMLTGDNEKTAKAIGKQAGVDEVIAGVLPDGKGQIIEKLKQQGKTAMVGDGINDAPALTKADMGIAIGAGTDVAIDAADIVLMKSRLSDVPAAIRLSRATLKNIHQNLFWAFFYNIIGIPLAAGIWIPIFGWELSPMFGAAAMSLSSFCVVTNALRLNFVKIYDSSKDKKRVLKPSEDITIKNQKEEEEDMTKTMKIEGMMCMHCEARVKKVLEALPQVKEAVVSHEAGTAILTLNADIANDELKKVIEDQDYKVTGIE